MTDNHITGNGLLDNNHDDDFSKEQGKATHDDENDSKMENQEDDINPKVEPERWLEYCKNLVFKYRKLIQQSKGSYYKKEGDVGYLISMKWLDQWKKVVYYDHYYKGLMPQFDPERPTKIDTIDNDSLLRDRSTFYNDVDENSYYNYILKPNMKMNSDYKVVDPETWEFFHSRYGGTEIKRFYYKTYSFGAEIEAKLKEFKVSILPTLENWDKKNITEPKSIFTSKHDTFQTLLDRLVEILNSDKYRMNLSQDTIRTWKLGYTDDLDEVDLQIQKAKNADMEVEKGDERQESDNKKVEKNTGVKFPGTSLEMMKKFEIDDLEISVNDTLVLEQASGEDSKFIFYYEEVKILGYGKCEYCYSHKPLVVQCRCEEVRYCSDDCMKKDERFHIDKCNAPIDVDHDAPFKKKDRARNGLTGIQNLGNTCFMSSSIQCLSNTFPLSKYFLDEKYKQEINTENVLGTGGKLAVQFARLLNELWNEESPVVTPWSFKKIVGNFQPMFSGFAQHDSAELLSFVLDGLHEDLNRVKSKPYYEMPDLKKGTSEIKCAELSWKYHLLRNQSLIVDMMQGQYKSTLCCPKCHNISVTYDPYMLLSLPVPLNEIYTSTYYFLFYDNNKCPSKSRFYLKKSCTVMDLRKQIAEQMDVDPWSFVLCHIDNNDMERMFCRNRIISDLADEDGILFAFQIDPDVFENEKVPSDYKRLMKCYETSDPAVDMSNDDDYNNSMNRDWVKIPLRFTMMEKSKYSFYERKKDQTFPRVIWVNRNWDLITVHKKIFMYLRYYFDIELEGFAKNSDEEAFMNIFDDLTEKNWPEKLGKGDDPGEYAYSLNIVNTEKKSYYSKGIEFFGLNNFENIPLPFEQNKTIGELIDAYFLAYENKEDSSDDDNYGDIEMETGTKQTKETSTTVKNNTNDAYFDDTAHKFGEKRKCFELEVFWNKDRLQAKIDKLTRCKKHEKYAEISHEADKTTSDEITLNQCFESFMQTEMLGKDNAWYCRNCKDHVEAKKQIELFNTPPILMISLKRFKSGKGSYFKDKIEDKVNFPVDHLDISDIVLSNKNPDGSRKKDIIYELYAVSNHYGNMGFGHYTAYAKNPLDNEWYDFDDSHVTQVDDPTKVVTEAAYNLYYRRKDFKFDDNIDYDAIKHSCDFEEFKQEVAHYRVPDIKEEAKSDEVEAMQDSSAPSGTVDQEMEES